MDKKDELNLKARYLVWLYKTTKEAFDRYERKFTQIEIDELLLKEIEAQLKDTFLPREKEALEKFVNEYREYIANKEEDCLKLKYKGKKINPEFLFLDVKLEAVEKVIRRELGKAFLEKLRQDYHEEMLRRIMEERQQQKI